MNHRKEPSPENSAIEPRAQRRAWLLGPFIGGLCAVPAFAPSVPSGAQSMATAPLGAAIVTHVRDASESSLSPLERLGKLLFEDAELSEPPGQACGSCHDPARAFTGNHGSSFHAVAAGSRPGVFGSRNVPTLLYASFRPAFAFVSERDGDGPVEHVPVGGFFWDGRADTLAEQAKGPLLNPREMNNASPASVVEKVRRASYAPLFRSVYGSSSLDDAGPAFERVAEALAAFERSPRFRPFSSKFDEVLRGRASLDPEEARGFELFKDPERGNCIACHAGDPESLNPSDWLFTDFTFDALGLPQNRRLPDDADARGFDLGLCRQEGIAEKAPTGYDVAQLCGAFQVPTLRNVELTAPYGHNGAFETLRDVVRFYVTRDTHPERWYPTLSGRVQRLDDLPARYRRNVNSDEPPYDRKRGERPRLGEDEIDAVVAFLRTLTDR